GASISRTRWPLARPPIAGLQDMRATARRSSVTMAVAHPMRAEASAASQPACPAPMTTTSKRPGRPASGRRDGGSLPDAEVLEDALVDPLHPHLARDLSQAIEPLAQVEGQILLARAVRRRRLGAGQGRRGPLQQVPVPHVGQEGLLARRGGSGAN